MPFPPGTRLGPYEILSPLGAGGMGEVYRARDSRLGRTVALKVLPQRFSRNPEHRQRLEHEARTISQIAHPNICTLHDIGHHDGVDFLVLEFLEGRTLRELLNAGPLPIRKVIPIAVQIAEGLAKAHEFGVVHRDLKPENIMVSPDAVKILDFGLAKPTPSGEGDFDNSTTVAQTEPGVLLGTFRYMSPEQAAGRLVDFRSDQFAFGVVLYEMTARKHPFRKPTHAHTLVAIAEEEPEPLGSLNPEAPPPLCWVVERCLAKEPEKRYFSTRDLVRDLTAIRDRLSDLQLKRHETRPSNLPVPSASLVGRENELATVQELLLRREVRLVTVTGPAGIGKSRLALALASAISEHFPSGVYFAPLASVNDPNLIASVIAQSLGVRLTKTQSPLETLKEYLRTSFAAAMLLFIDNFEHLLGAAPLLAELLALAPSMKVLVTSRAALRVYDEHEFPLPPLTVPDTKKLPPLEQLPQYSAVSLFVQRAAAIKHDFKLTEQNASDIAEICARLDGLPLAIELAAARIRLLSTSAMRSRLASRLQLLTGGSRDLPTRQQTLRQAIDWSYDLLNDSEQKLFRRLSVFVGGCTLEAVESVGDTRQDLGIDVLDGMASMVDKSLVRQFEQPDGEPRFFMLETIREYALEKLAASGEEHRIRRAHAAYCLVVAEEGASGETDLVLSGWLDHFEIEHDNFRAALDWLTQTSDVEWGLRLGAALFRFWEMREYLAEGRDRLGKLLDLPAACAPSGARLRALFAAGVLAGVQGDYATCDILLAQSLDIARYLADQRSIAVALNALGVNSRDRGDLSSASSHLEESLVLWRQLQDPRAEARALSNLAVIAKLQDNYARARSLYQDCLTIFRELHDHSGIAWALNHQGDVARDQGDTASARSLYESSLATFREIGDQWGIAGTLADLGNLAREQQDYHLADSLYRESLAVFHVLEHKRGIARLLESFACSAAEQSDPERSLRLAGAAAALRESIGAPPTPPEQAKLERTLEQARRRLPIAQSRTVWLEGWVMPIERAVEDVLRPSAASG